MLGVVNPAPWVYVGTDDPCSPAYDRLFWNVRAITQGNRI